MPGTGYDVVAAQGSLTLGGATFSLSLGFAPSVGQVFMILDNDAAEPVVGTFAGLPEATIFTAGGATFHISYKGGNGNDVQLSVLPVTPTLIGTASPSVDLGGAINDTGTLNFGASPTGTMTFTLYGPNNATCATHPGVHEREIGRPERALPIRQLRALGNGRLPVDRQLQRRQQQQRHRHGV